MYTIATLGGLLFSGVLTFGQLKRVSSREPIHLTINLLYHVSINITCIHVHYVHIEISVFAVLLKVGL